VEAIIFTGVQGSGKSTFYAQRFAETHVRINLDMLKTRHREQILLKACIEAKQPFVVDNTNVTADERARYIVPAKGAGFRITGYYFRAGVGELLQRNRQRPLHRVVPDKAIFGTYSQMQPPTLPEGYDILSSVRLSPTGEFLVEAWVDDL
jgi:predicted kinase